ncbi:Golgin [Hirschfeldia incana]|nr:Golgin [Hirschfeldia incana]KAJ0231464.1 Golgin [Hirschfeldia incana]
MASGEIVSRLHLLIDRCVRRHAERAASLPAEAIEKDLLLSLSQVLREIQSWISEAGLDSDSDQGEETAAPESKDHLRLERLVADLVGFLGVKNVHVQHLSGNILVQVSQSLVESGSLWNDFVRLVFDCLHLAVVYICPVPSPTRFEGSNTGGSDVLKGKMEKANWCTVSGVFRVLRNVLKRLSQEENEELIDVYLESLNSTLVKIPWSRMDIHFSNPHGSGERSSHGNNEGVTVFLGNFVQFLSTVVQQVHFAEDSDAFGTMHLILQKTIELVPDLLRWCQPKLESQSGSSMSRYLVHKLLVLMIRLTYQSNIRCTVLLSWLQYLQHRYQGFLHHTLTRHKPVQDNSLEGSPFLVSLSDRDANETHSDHLQRLSVFLFLRCSLTLLYSSRHTDKDCEFDCRKKGMEGVFKWIEQQVPSDTFLDHGTYSKKSVDFSTSFIQLFMHEDDLLFKVLLQLLSAPLDGKELLKGEGSLPQDEEIYVRLSTLFNPVILFCIFLSELHYDHQVLLDYLISKDIGASCAEYLLRCLRAVCDSWTLFVEFPFEENLNNSSSKRRRLLLETPEAEQNRKLQPQAFENAKDCLLSLQNSIVRLHQKKLFPYNPEALLRRLSRFQELCLLHE